jgi:hypothetical protein
MEVNQFKEAFKEHYNVTDDYVEEPAFDPTVGTDSISTDSLAMDSASVAKRKQLQLDDTNNTQKRVDESTPDQYKDNASDPNQYKMEQQDTQYEGQEGDQNKANNKSTIEEQQQKQKDQEQLKNLFK